MICTCVCTFFVYEDRFCFSDSIQAKQSNRPNTKRHSIQTQAKNPKPKVIMGNSNSAFTGKELDEYQDLTYLTKKEIINVFNRFCALAESDEDRKQITRDKRGFYLDKDAMEQLEELQVNPFRTRILQGKSTMGWNCCNGNI